ncbi:MAG: hypothetical protein ACREEH_00400 [Caulobacteraceae bacterium]
MALLASFGSAAPTVAQTRLPTTPKGWRKAAAEDLVAIHDILRDNSPAMVVDRDSASFRTWLEKGLKEARAGVPKVTDSRGYYFILRGYVGGFRDSHIGFAPTGWSINLHGLWPGFVLGLRDGRYEVVFRGANVKDVPPVGARLLSCDGQSVAQLVAARDRYDGNFALASGRFYGAPRLLSDMGNPFVTPPKSCKFGGRGGEQRFALVWRAPDKAVKVGSQEALAEMSPHSSKLAIEPWAGRGWWISVPSMTADQDWNGFYAQKKARLPELREAPVVVIDVRGNGGGDSAFGDRLIRLLWGDAMVDARKPDLGPIVWRVSRLNRDNWAEETADAVKDKELSAEDKSEMRRILARYDSALAEGDPTFELEGGQPSKLAQSGPDLVRGRVVVLTDHACVSACLDLMDEIMALPHVVQAGTTTSADTIFMDLTIVPKLPSGLISFGFGRKAWIRRPRGSNVPYVPAKRYTWTGPPPDERAWLAEELFEPAGAARAKAPAPA